MSADELRYNKAYYEIVAKIDDLELSNSDPAAAKTEDPLNNSMTSQQWSTLIDTLTQRKRQIEIPKFKGDAHLYD